MRLIDVLQLMHTAPTESSLCQQHNILLCETDRDTHQHVSCANCPIGATQKAHWTLHNLPRPHLLDDLK
ncbi:hypothetical protein [Pantoea eucrina]|uniref:hypothetical protein n=1 Tax=Pantoea eucrina TaxID=472693 RepID=UPI00080F4012|nr:hypothetical protein [Pantoea eucrina]